ncbi:hemicentin-1-like isoform X2 [Limulus polyphemus]|uniref:Hemicentin-1-like isoform X2 n=1 Tax=Limulus polyphemus TaxID=6850 RepID=A0ABM1S9W3_LIMPO|nr:hemicentin-1-like isoform X2 [Limulus polyphemus]
MKRSRFYSYLNLLILIQVAMSGVPGIKLKAAHYYYDGQKEYPEYDSVVGRKITLPCNITPPSQDDRVSLVLWYHGTSENPLYSVDARNEPVAQAKRVVHDEYASRATLNITIRTIYLIIEPVTEEDAGEYRCRVDYQIGRTTHRKLKVNIIVPPKEIYVRHGDQIFNDGSVGPIEEDSFLNLTCEATGGKPPPSVIWWHGSTLLDDTYWKVSEEIVANTLVIPYVHRNYSFRAFTCNASNTDSIIPASVTVELDLVLKPQIVRISAPKNPLVSGSAAEIMCQTNGSFPLAEVTWWMEGKKMKQYNKPLTDSTRITTSYITITPKIGDNGKTLVCQAKNPRLPESTLEDSWKLDVQYEPLLSLTLRTSDKNNVIQEGTDVYLECNINANPQFRELLWKFNGKILISNPVNGIVIQGPSLILRNVTRAQDGIYHCVADNVIGKGQSNDIHMAVSFAPVCETRQKTIYIVGRQEKVRIYCEVTAKPTDVVFRWTFNTSSETVDADSVNSTGTTSFAVFSPKCKYDYGIVYCWGENIIGIQKEPCVFNILPAARPDPVANCSVENQTQKSFTVECTAGDDGGLTQHFHLVAYNRKSNELLVNHTSLDLPIFKINGLPPGSPLRIFIYASNAQGNSISLVLETRTLLSAEKHTGNLPPALFSPLLAILLGLILVLVILAVIVLFTIKQRRTRMQQGVTLGSSNGPKSNDHLKTIVDQTETEEKCPDLIPFRSTIASTEFDDTFMSPSVIMTDMGTHQIYENLKIIGKQTYGYTKTHQEFIPHTEKLVYNELAFPESKAHVLKRSNQTEYVHVDRLGNSSLRSCPGFENAEELDGYSVETPLMKSLKNERRWEKTERKRSVISTAV